MNKILALGCALLLSSAAGCSNQDPDPGIPDSSRKAQAQPAPAAPRPTEEVGKAVQAATTCNSVGGSGPAQSCELDGTSDLIDATIFSAALAPFDLDMDESNLGGARELCVAVTGGYSAVATDQRRAGLKFSFSRLPSSVIVTSASLQLYAVRGGGITGTVATSTKVGIHKISTSVVDWTETAFAAGTQSWNCGCGSLITMTATDGHALGGVAGGSCATCPTTTHTSGTQGGPCGVRLGPQVAPVTQKVAFTAPAGDELRWTLVDTEYNSDPSGTGASVAADRKTISAAGAVTFSGAEVTDDVRTWVSGTANNRGWVVIPTASDTPATNSGQPVIFSSSETAGANSPKLTVTYKKAPGQVCTTDAACALADGSDGICVGGICCNVGTCGDSNVCTTHSCTAGTGACVSSNNTASCDDGLFCTSTDTCSGGTCSGTGNPCTGAGDADSDCSEMCDETNNNCNGTDPNGSACSDGLFCNGTDTCSSGVCSTHTGDPCPGPDGDGDCSETCDDTADACTGNDTAGSACTDSLFCNGTDTCGSGGNAGLCSTHTGDPCPGADGDGDCSETCDEAVDTCTGNDTAGSACTDSLFCNGADTCGSGGNAGLCSTHAGDPCPGPDGDGDCSETCSESADACTGNDTAGSACTDSLFCNGADTCGSGGNAGLCSTHVGDPCPGADGDGDCSETCNETADDCSSNDTNGTSCNDGLFCTVTDTCTTGSCGGTGNPCPGPDGDGDCSETCNETADDCTANDTAGSSCTDSLFCNGADTCGSGGNAGLCSTHVGDPCPGPDGDGDCSETCDETADACTGNDTAGSACTDSLFCNGTDTCGSGGNAGLCSTHAGDPCPGADGDGDCSETCSESADACTANDTNGSSCTDGLFCTVTDTCTTGTCGGTGDPCPGPDGDGNCAESCNEGTDACTAADTNGSACTDSLFCNGADTCSAGACSTHVGDPCPGPDGDGNCAESCNEGTDACTAADTNGSSCTDGLFCTVTDTCTSGTCGGTGNPCPGPDGDGDCSESCNEGTDACTANDTNGSTCTDSLFCNGADTCSAGACSTHVGDPCPGADGDGNCSESCNEASDACTAADTNGSSCTDSLFCNGTDTCSSGTCSGHTGDPCPGPDGDGNCAESCSEAADACTANDTNGSACTDSLFCNGTDTCTAGACSTHAGDPCPGPDGDGDCSETCNEPTDTCTANDTNGSSCSDGLFCTSTDTCATGTCGGTGNPCPGPDGDGNCAESCNEGADNCTANDTNGSACTDSLFCNGSDTCSSGSCSTHVGDPCPGPDGDSNCTESCNEAGDSCNAADPNGSSCNDGLFCTATDSCGSGTCGGTGNPCPGADGDGDCTETCAEGTDDCTAPDPNGSSCNDGLFCTTTDTCGSGTCGGTGNPCPGPDGDGNCAESCNETSDNCTANDTNGSACTDSLFCNGTDTCQTGACSTHTGNPCPGPDGDGNCAESCNETSDNCTASDTNGSACNDGTFCNGTDTCQTGACSTHAGNPCPGPDGDADCSETCDESGGSCNGNDTDGTSCPSDGNVCTVDTCQSGFCSTPVAAGSIQCRAPTCSGAQPNAQAIPAEFCNGTSTCPGPNNVACGAQPCNGTSCQGGCSTDANCASGFYCSGGTCLPKGGLGAACTRDAMCSNDQCVDNVCCATACGGGDTSDCQQCTAGTGACGNLSGTSCDDSVFCNGTDTCAAGVCSTHTGNPCPGPDGDANCAESCNETGDACNAADTNGSACTDSLFCNGIDTCTGGACSTHAGDPCPGPDGDGNCSESCNEGTDACSAADTNGSACTDSLFCNGTDTCAAGACSTHVGNPCPGADGDADCSESCNEAADDCSTNDANGSACSDALFCNGTDTCAAGNCSTHAGNPCPGADGDVDCSESCNEGTDNCTANDPDGTVCPTDGNVCTQDTCVGGLCNTPVPTGVTVCRNPTCSGSPPSATSIPQETCNGTATCPGPNPVACGASPCNGTLTSCQGGCTSDAQCPSNFYCNGSTCVATQPNGQACARAAMCQNNICVDSVCCGTACGGGDTTDCQSCNAGTPGTCTNLTGTACSDGTFCNGADTCQAGACSTHAGNPCPGPDGDANCAESCNEATDACTASDTNGSACNDGTFCNGPDSCSAGVCSTHSGNPCPGPDGDVDCSETCDENADNCNGNDTDGTACPADSNVCTQDSCQAGLCNRPVAAGSVVCRAASCSGATPNAVSIQQETCDGTATCPGPDNVACGAAPCNGTACQGGCSTDANCPSGFYCDAGACFVKAPVGGTCDRNGECQNDRCVDSVCCSSACGGGNAADCQACNVAGQLGTCSALTGTACDDGVFCNGGDSCNAGACGTHSGDPCPGANGNADCSETCNEAADDCTSNDPSGSTCNDGIFCNGADTCQAGACSTHVGDPCPGPDTDSDCSEACDELGDICNLNDPNGSACGDNVFCNGADTCQAGACSQHAGSPCPGADGDANCSESCDETADACSASDPNGSACGNDGNPCTVDTCQAGACHAPVPAGTVQCGTASCTGTVPNAQATPAASCDGTATCPTPAPLACGSSPCNAGATACQGGCGADAECPTGFFCGGTGCQTKVPQGGACTRDGMCAAGPCVDGVCCSSACGGGVAGDCQACNEAGFLGQCRQLTGATCDDGSACTTGDACNAGTCTGGPAPTCNDSNPCTVDFCDPVTGCGAGPGNSGVECRAASGPCDTAEACDGVDPTCPTDAFSTGTVCSAGTCSNGQATLPGLCNGAASSCPAGATLSCAPYACGATGCLTACTNDNQCAQGNRCDAVGGCVSKGDPGTACTAADQCLSSFCVDGVCCNSDCGDQCAACNVPGLSGTCSPRLGAPAGSRPACAGDDTGCNGICDGRNTLSCALPGNAVQCRPGSCTGGVATLTGFCNGTGSCPAVQTQDCGAGQVCAGATCGGCTTDIECGTGNYCRAGVCTPKATNGSTCSQDTECGSGQCVDGVCCNSDCAGQCEACNVTGSVGQCTAVTGAPAAGRTACNGTGTCGGTCDGTNRVTCTYPGLGIVCRDPECNSNRATALAFCNGAGECPAIEQVDCPTGCDGLICGGGCFVDANCAFGQYCAAGVCTNQKGSGETCNTAGECSSSYCVDGVCCGSPCGGQCEACDVPSNEGACVPVTGAPRGARQACESDGNGCGGQCDGTNTAQCDYPDGTSCRGASCTNGVASLAATCQGNGSCGPVQLQPCGVAGCDTAGVLCDGGCTTNADCAGTEYCSGGICEPKLPPGAACGSVAQCASGNCVGGTCCNTACTGQCESCNQAGQIGTCVAVSGLPRDGRPACSGLGACAGVCDGTSRNTCTSPGAAVTCGVGFCADGYLAAAPVCNGSGTCITVDLAECAPYACDPDPSDPAGCLTSCGTDTDCAPGSICSGGACLEPLPDGGLPDSGPVDSGAGGADAGPGPDASAGGAVGGAGGAVGGAGGSVIGAGGAGVGGGAAGGSRPDAGTGPDASDGPDSKDEGSCGCRVPGHTSPNGGALALALGCLALVARRRRPRNAAAARSEAA